MMLESSIRTKLETVLWQEELLWVQKSCSKWVVEGDRNTKFFHLATLKRRAFNRVSRLQNEEGLWVADQLTLQTMAVDFFTKLFHSSRASLTRLQGFSACIPAGAVENLDRPLSATEIHSALKRMGGLTAPGKDGFQPIFYQKCWDIVGTDFVDFVADCFRIPEKVLGVNSTLLTLIPKKAIPTSMMDFRPISLCNVAYKTLTKCVANRIKGLMCGLTHPSQTSFVPGRHITDNILILQEVVHSMNSDYVRKPNMVIKIDLAKAYDKIEWNFVRDTLDLAGFPSHLCSVIMNCISTASFQVLWNGSCSESFKPTRGLRQGCPLSPYLFTLCIERLSQMIMSAVSSTDWKPIKLAPNGVSLSHIFFADDLVLFSEASTRQADICRILGISATQNLGRYLGVPVIHGRTTSATYDFLLDRMNNKLAGWKANSLSLAGRVTLASSVLNSLPSYVMQTAFLPVSLCDQIDRKIRDFIWGSGDGVRKIHNINWETVCKPKSLGGLGLRSARDMNMAFLMKVAWGLFTRPEELWAKVLLTKYLQSTDNGYVAARTKGFSAVWRGLKRAGPILNNGTQWAIRSGAQTMFWTDRWIDSGTILIDHALDI
ncbi:LINE-1 retrotransposable element ORF2 protein [Linum grandiflorum]